VPLKICITAIASRGAHLKMCITAIASRGASQF
jgi:sulfur relay (sulfurtransferase) complex TusBCD TusD component (DsrE family)